jgi:hypothetical protein
MNEPTEHQQGEPEDRESTNPEPLTLDPPGSIAVIGAGPIGIEAALYGRYLGYDVAIFEADSIGSSMRDQCESPLAMLPDRCLSPLAISALHAQRQAAGSVATTSESEVANRSLPMTFGQWIDHALVPLIETDLLRGRLRTPARVTEIATVPVQPDQDGEDTSDIPPDFGLNFVDRDGQRGTHQVEAVIRATGSATDADLEIKLGFPLPAPYFFQIGQDRFADPEQDLRNGWREIVAIYAELMGRSELDLYRPRRE